MRFSEKLKRLAQGVNKAELAKKAGLSHPTIISNVIRRGGSPRIDIALKIARGFGVPLEWLADDEKDFPPPASPIELLDDDVLMREVARRYIVSAQKVDQYLTLLENNDWEDIANTLLEIPIQEGLPSDLNEKIKRLVEADSNICFFIAVYDPSEWANIHHSELPIPQGMKIKDMDLATLYERWHRIMDTSGWWNQAISGYVDVRKLAVKSDALAYSHDNELSRVNREEVDTLSLIRNLTDVMLRDIGRKTIESRKPTRSKKPKAEKA